MDDLTGSGDSESMLRGGRAGRPGLLARYAAWVVDHRRWVIAAVLAITVVLGLFATRQHVVIDPATVVPQDHPYIRATNTIERIFGSKYLVVIGITPEHGDALQPQVIDAVRRITDRLYAAPSVIKRTLLSLASPQAKAIQGTPDGFEVQPLLAMVRAPNGGRDALKAALEANPIYRDTVISADWRTATIMVELKENADGFGAMLVDVQRILDAEHDPHLKVALGGNAVFLRQAETFARRINWLFPIAILVIGLLHYEAFRTKQGFILPLVTALLSVVWGVGVMGLLHVPRDIFNSPTPILILAIAAGHAVQLLKRYYESFIELVKLRHVDPREANRLATIDSVVAVGPVLAIAGGVAALGFFSLVVFDMETVRAFGIFTGIGILTAVVLEFTFTPAVRASLPPPSMAQIDTETRPRIWDRISASFADAVVSPRARRWALGAVALVVMAAIAGWPRVHVDNASRTFFSDALPLQRDDALLNRQTGGTNVLYVMVDAQQPGGAERPDVLAAMHALQQEAARSPIVGKTVSLYDYLQRMDVAMSGAADQARALPANRNLIAQYLLLYSISGDPEDFASFVDDAHRRAKVAIMLRTNSNAEIKRLVDDLRAHVAVHFPAGTTVSFGGEVAQTLAVTEVMVHSKLLNILQILAVIFAVSAIAFRSLLAGALVLSPLLVVLAVIFGVMGYFGVPLNIPNSLIAAMAVGIGADYAIYLIYRINEYVGQHASLPAAVDAALRTAGKACLFVATAVAGGYAVLLLSYDYKVHVWLATFIILAMLISVASALTIIPGVILMLKPKFVFRRRSGHAPAVLLIVIAAVAFLAYSQLAWSAPPAGAAAAMAETAAVTRFETSTSNIEFALETSRGGRLTRRATLASKLRPGGVDAMRLVRFQAPADIRGTSTLLIEHAGGDDDMWVYLPALRRVRRLVASNKKDSFFGTDFSYGDVIGYKVADWIHTELPAQSRDGVPCRVIESVPANATVKSDSGYGKRTTWIRKDNHVTVFVATEDTGGHPYKEFAFSELRQVDPAHGKWQPMTATGTNLQTGHRTTIRFSDFKVGASLSDALFAPDALAAD